MVLSQDLFHFYVVENVLNRSGTGVELRQAMQKLAILLQNTSASALNDT